MKLNLAVSALVLSVLASGLSACGNLAPLTDQQKATVKATSRSAVATSSAAPQKAFPSGGSFGDTIQIFAAAVTPGVPNPSPTSSPTVDAEMQRARAAVAQASQKCTQEMTSSAVDGALPFITGGFKVYGEGCPIAMELKVEAGSQASATKVNAKLGLTYAVLDAELKKLNDVDQFNLKAEVNAESSSNANKFSGKVEGDVNSQKEGKLRFKLEASGSSNAQGQGNGQFVIRYDFKDFTAEGKVEMSSSSNEAKYTVNGETVTQTQFFDLMAAGLSLPASPSSVDSAEFEQP